MIFRARVWRLLACVLLAFLTLSLVYSSSWLSRHDLPNIVIHSWHTAPNCSNDASAAYLKRLCRDYLNGVVGGSLCEPLCVRKEVEFVKCLGHGIKMHVLKAQWAGNSIALKTTEPARNYSVVAEHIVWLTDHNRLISKEEFVLKANLTLFMNLAGGRVVGRTEETVERVFSECDVLGDGQLSYSEAVVCWSLLETDEFVLLSLLRGLSAVPDLYGACGNMYASQFATSKPLDSQLSLIDSRSWSLRARLAMALIHMVASLENTPYGTLYLCDVKGPNFGVVREPGSDRLTAKTIDLDLSSFDTSSDLFCVHRERQCHRDSDCTYVDCRISCDRGTCSGPIISNNLQVLCANLLAPGWLQLSLLHSPPASIETELGAVLDQCSHYSSIPQPHINTTIMNRLLSLLQSSLLSPS